MLFEILIMTSATEFNAGATLLSSYSIARDSLLLKDPRITVKCYSVFGAQKEFRT